MQETFSRDNFTSICDLLAKKDPDLHSIIETHGYPPMWNRPNSFETLVHFILEQQVSLASALAALNKLRQKVKKITPSAVLKLTDDELRACYFSRQKTVYVRTLAEAIHDRSLVLEGLNELPDEEVRARLISLKGIGNWTADVYMIFVLQRRDIFPMGDLAAINALKRLKKMKKDEPREKLLAHVSRWQPHRTIATMLLWHYYLSNQNKN